MVEAAPDRLHLQPRRHQAALATRPGASRPTRRRSRVVRQCLHRTGAPRYQLVVRTIGILATQEVPVVASDARFGLTAAVDPGLAEAAGFRESPLTVKTTAPTS